MSDDGRHAFDCCQCGARTEKKYKHWECKSALCEQCEEMKFPIKSFVDYPFEEEWKQKMWERIEKW